MQLILKLLGMVLQLFYEYKRVIDSTYIRKIDPRKHINMYIMYLYVTCDVFSIFPNCNTKNIIITNIP